jgi:hypothetical protein
MMGRFWMIPILATAGCHLIQTPASAQKKKRVRYDHVFELLDWEDVH